MKIIVFRLLTCKIAAALFFTLIVPVAYAQGLAKPTSLLENIRDNLAVLVPIIAVIAGLLIVVAYWFRMVEKDTFVRWLVGLIIAGSVAEIVALFV